MPNKNAPDSPQPLRPVDDFIKEIGGPTKWDAGPSGSSERSSAPADEGPITRGIEAVHDFVGRIDPLGGAREVRAGQGVAKFGAGAVTGLPRLANAGIGLISPRLSESLGDLAEKVPGVKRMENFAAAPSESKAENLGYYGALGASMAVNPFRALGMAEPIPGVMNLASAPGREAAAFVPKLTPVVSHLDDVEAAGGNLDRLAEIIGRAERTEPPEPGIEFTKQRTLGPQKTFQAPPPLSRADKIRAAAGTAGRAAAEGAVAGAATDPNDPGAGAATGAVFGAATPGVGKFLQGKWGQWLAGQSARHGPLLALNMLAHHLGIPAHWLWESGLAQLFVWHHAPGGSMLQAFGEREGSRLGRLAARARGRGPGAAGGSLADLVEQRGPSYFSGGDTSGDEAAPAEAE